MNKKEKNHRIGYSDEEHAIELFDSNSRYFGVDDKEFDILPYSERYYSDNYECFNHKHRLEILSFIRILKEKKLIEQVGKTYNIVKITQDGLKRIELLKQYASKNPYSNY